MTQVLTLCRNPFKLWQEVLYFSSKAWGVAKKLFTFLIQICRVVKRCFKIWHAVRIPIPKMTRCKNLFQIWFFSKLFIQKLLFIHFVSISWILRKQITAEVGALRDKKFQKDFVQAKLSSKSVFLRIKFTSKSDPLSNLFVRNLADSENFYSKLSSCKKCL